MITLLAVVIVGACVAPCSTYARQIVAEALPNGHPAAPSSFSHSGGGAHQQQQPPLSGAAAGAAAATTAAAAAPLAAARLRASPLMVDDGNGYLLLTGTSKQQGGAGPWVLPGFKWLSGVLGGPTAAGGEEGSGDGEHKPLLPLSSIDVVVLVLTAFTLVLAAGGGIGGGAIYMPLFCALGGFRPNQAVALSNVTIVGGAMANFIINIQRRHPTEPSAPLIDYALILIMEPTTILGALIGTYANKVLPGAVTVTLMAVLLSLLTVQLTLRAVRTYAAESALLRQRAALGGGSFRAAFAAAGGSGDDPLRRPLLRDSAGGGDDNGTAERGRSVSWSAPAPDAGAGGADQGASTPGTVNPLRAAAAAAAGIRDARKAPKAAVATVIDNDAGDALDNSGPQPDLAISVSYQGSGSGSFAAGLLPEDLKSPRSSGSGDNGNDGDVAAAPARVASALGAPPAWAAARGAGGGANSGQAAVAAAAERQPPAPRRRRIILPAVPMVMLLLLSLAVAASDASKALVPCGSWRYWVIVLSVVPPCLFVMLLARNHLLHRSAAHAGTAPAHLRRQSITGGVSGVNIKYTARNTIVYPAICTVAGVVAGMFGLGGGVIKAPLMLELGVLPEVATATSTTMILFTASAACLVYSNFGLIQYDYAVAFLFLGMLGSAVGQVGITRVVKRYGRRSMIIFTMVVLMLLASIVAASQAIGDWRVVWRQGAGALHWGDICTVGDGDA